MSQNIARDSRFELLRIIAITFVFLHHGILHLKLVNYWDIVPLQNNYEKIIGASLNSIFIIGVNLFILISGYFRMTFSLSKLTRLLLFCLICSLLGCIGADFSSIKSIIYRIIHLYTDNSFVPTYIALFLISPLLNKALNTMSLSELKKAMILFTVANVFMGFILDYSCIDANGYNIFNFIYLYILGCFLRQMPPVSIKKLFIIYIVSYICLVVWAYFYKSGLSAFSYNNPFVLLLSISFFLLISKVRIQSSLVNKLASASFAMFLLENTVRAYFFPIDRSVQGVHLFFNIIADYSILFLIAYLVTVLINRVYKYIKPSFKSIDDYFNFE